MALKGLQPLWFGAVAAIEDFAREFHLRWFDVRLKGQRMFRPFPDDRIEDQQSSPVTLFVMGGGDGRRDEKAFKVGGVRTSNGYFVNQLFL